jgi:hypothetical protein
MAFRSPQVSALTLSLVLAAMGARAADSFPGEKGDDPLDAKPVCVSGVYPHLAALGGSSNEFGIGVVVPWAGRLWFKTYSSGGPGNLYSVGPDLDLRVERKRIGGLGSRLIHRESNQLFITSCTIDASGNVRDLRARCGRHTAAMRHLTDPANKITYD